MRIPTHVVVVSCVLLLAPPVAARDATVAYHPPTLRLVHVREGTRSVAPERDMERLPETKVYQLAKRVGLDLAEPDHPLFLHRYHEGRLFYVFWKTAEDAVGDRPYLIQRIRKTQRWWPEEGAEPKEEVTYQVEVFKTRDGAIKRPDQHHASYGLRTWWRREIVKEYEIGFGEISGACEGADWPYDPGRLFEYVQRYDADPEAYENVRFFSSTPWTLRVSFGSDGAYRITSPELGIDAPRSLPDPASLRPPPDPASTNLVLTAGSAFEGLAFGESRREDVIARLGPPVAAHELKVGANLDFRGAITANFDASGTLNTLFTRPGFAGRTDRGIRHGDPRWRVMKVMGVPRGKKADAPTWVYDGVLFWFDAFDQVEKIVLYRPRR